MQAQGGGINNMQKLQDMQRQLQAQQMAAQFQHQGLQRQTNQQASMMGSTGSMGNLAQGAGGLGGMNQQFANQQWPMDPTQQVSAMSGQSSRSSLAGLSSNNAMAMMQQQTVAGMGMGGASAGNQSWLYGKSGSNNSGLGGMDLSSMTMPGSSSKLGGMLDQNQQMQALIQQNMGLGAQSSQMSRMNQGQLSSNDLGGLTGMGAAGAPGLGGAGNMLTQAQQMQQLQLSKMGGSSSSLLGMASSSGQGQMQQGNNLALGPMDLLKRQLNQGNDSRRSSSVSALSGVSQAQLLQLQQQQQQRNSSTSSMLGMTGAGLLDQQNQRNSLLGNNSSTNALMGQQRKPSLSSSTEPISLSSMMSGNDGSGISSSSSSNNRRSNDSSLLNVFDSNTPGVSASPSPSSSMLMAQAQLQQQMKKQGMNTMGLDASALLQQQQQQQLMGSGNMGQLSGTNDMQKQLLAGQLSRNVSSSAGQSNGNDMMSNNVFGDSPAAFGDLGGTSLPDKKGESGKARRGSSSRSSMKKPGGGSNSGSSEGQSFLGGTFAGGWQSNKDIPDRRNVIYSICKVIEEMRPDASKMSQKLPFMAKRLEEHLYRSAQTKEEYLNKATLKKRLQMIAHGLEVHRSDKDSKSGGDGGSGKNDDGSKPNQVRQQEMIQQLQQLQQMKQQQKQGSNGGLGGMDALSGSSWQQQKANDELLREHAKRLSRQGAGLSTLINDGSLAGTQQQLQGNILQQAQQSSSRQSTSRLSGTGQEGILKAGGNSKYPQPDPQKRRVIKQQQQRLLLLRHASKCKSGASCKVKFCDQMVQLWKHMKKCRDKHCKTPHCLSSRCVLNHYRICKSENKTASCEVCGPVTKQIKQQNAGGDTSAAPGNKDAGGASGMSSMNSKMSGVMDQLTQDKRQQLEKLQLGQHQLAQQEMLMKQLQQQQQQLIEQQKSIQQQQQHVLPHSPEEQQLQQRQALLQQLQQQFTNQKMLLQQQLLQQQSNQNLTGSSNQLGVSSQLSLDQPDAAKRSSGSRRTSKSKSSMRIDAIASNQAVARAGKGKRLSTLEHQIQDPLKSGSKRTAGDVGLPVGVQSSKAIKTEQGAQEPDSSRPQTNTSKNADTTPDETKSTKDKVLEQGDADRTTSLIGSMDPSSIEKHLDSLQDGLHLTSRTITHRCLPVLSSLLEDQYGWVFRDAVDPDVLGLPDYFDVVKNPMHLSLIEKKLENGVYKDLESFERDTKLVFENAILYNGEESEVGDMAKTMLRLFDREYKKVLDGIKGGQVRLMKNGDICALCTSQRRLFEPAVLVCSGTCGTTKIRRNCYYYTDPSKSNFWCVNCFTALKDDEAVILDDGSNLTKYQLQKLKNDATPEEAWVQCDTCNSWVHQICALFNGRKNKTAASYSCPKCHLKKAAAGELKKSDDSMKGACQLPHCKMSQTIEQGLHDSLEKAYRERALELRIPYAEVEKAEGLSVRVISNMEKKHVVRDEMFERYSKRGCPQEFPVRSKCVALFQTIHGVDVILFGMYVFEYNHECPAPNKRRVYISYIDSVNYFRPKAYRTLTYQTIIVEYLRYVKERGFHTAHIWSCPPSPGDDYIFHIHPTQQRIPKDDMLCQWYHDVLEKAKSDGVVIEVRTLYDEYFKNNGEEAITGNASDPTCLPYFEGDYIPGELENIIKDVKADEEAKRRTNPNWEEERPPSSSNRTGKKTGTRSNPGSLVNVGQDKVMLRLGLAVSNMKQNFFVARLRSREFATAVERGDDVSEWKEDNDGSLSNKRPKIGGKATSGSFGITRPDQLTQAKIENPPAALGSGEDTVDISVATKVGSSESAADKPADDDCSLGTVSVSLGQSNMEVVDAFGDSKSSFDGDKSDKMSSVQVVEDDGTLDTSDHTSLKGDWDDPLLKGKSDDAIDTSGPSDDHVEKHEKTHEGLAGSTSSQSEEDKSTDQSSASKRGFAEMGPAIARHFAAMNAMKKPVGDTKDDDPPQELELFESRQQFLSYCQKNHFQFDELRRAKHTTMMVLYQLHNPNAPKFLQQCGACLREITKGVRYHCNTCSNFDLCEDCYEPVMKGEWTQRDKRLAHDPTHVFFRVKVDAMDKGDKKNTEERARAIKAHLELLSHAASCDGPPSCSLNNCQRMKKYFEHVKACNISPKKSCKVCSRLLALLTIHSRLCTVRGRCPLPYCDRIRERNRRRTRQQQQMDDRRRQAQNQLYRQSEQHT